MEWQGWVNVLGLAENTATVEMLGGADTPVRAESPGTCFLLRPASKWSPPPLAVDHLNLSPGCSPTLPPPTHQEPLQTPTAHRFTAIQQTNQPNKLPSHLYSLTMVMETLKRINNNNKSSLGASIGSALSGAAGPDGAHLINHSLDGGPDVGVKEMPPDDYSDGGRDRHVRDVTAPNFQNPSAAVFVKFPTTTTVLPITPSSSPTGIDCHSLAAATTQNNRLNNSTPLAPLTFKAGGHQVYSGRPNPSPLLTPCSSSDSLSLTSGLNTRLSTPAILTKIFPDGIHDVEAIHDISTQLPNGLKGAIVDRPSGVRSLYILGLNSSVTMDSQVRDVVVRVLDLADEEIEADQVIFALEKDNDQFRELLQGLLYVGGAVVKNAQHQTANNNLVLVGIEV
ncbi:hypothetical protein KEM48_004763 [Puccinia striiformis f. sp. tritici PST-130]|nr:hypothetical protein KEM48_004763 [Puccinia striiformis f. sp. tritici PST-130]